MVMEPKASDPTSVAAEAFVTEAYRKYGEFTLEERAIPAAQDGMLPVHRRVLFAMYEMGLRANTPPRKSAAIVGDVMGKYHPHGDVSIYGALVTLCNPSMTHLGGDPRALVQPQGNFGIPRPGEGDREVYPPAAMRYTEARLSKIGEALFATIDVAEMVPSFDGTRAEPWVFPSRLPLLLMMDRGVGIALGANTQFPPHHPRGLLQAARHLLRHPEATIKEVVRYVKGPDYGHSSVISTRAELREMYRAGKGSIYFVCDHHIQRGTDCHELVITSLAPGFQWQSFIKLCTQLEAEGKILAFNDSTDRKGPSIIIQFKDPAVVTERLIPRLRTCVSYNWNVQDRSGGASRFARINLLDYLSMWLEHCRKVEHAMLRLEGKRAHQKLRQEFGKLAGIQNIEALARILGNRKLTEAQSNAAIKAEVKLTWGGRVVDLDDEQVQVLLDQKVRALRALHLEEQMEACRKLIAQIKRVKHDLAHLDDYLEAQLTATEALFPAKYERGTKLLDGVQPELTIPEAEGGGMGFWCVNRLGYLRPFAELPLRKGKWYEDSWTVKATPSITLVDNAGKAHTFQSVYLTPGKSGVTSVVGVATEATPAVLVVDAQGHVGVVDLPLKKQAVIMKTDHKIVFAAGVHPGDTVCITDGRNWGMKAVGDIGSKRPNSQGVRLLKKVREGAELQVYIIPAGGVLVANGEGQVDFENVTGGKVALFGVAKTGNFVVDQNNEKKVLSLKEAVSAAQDPGIQQLSLLR